MLTLEARIAIAECFALGTWEIGFGDEDAELYRLNATASGASGAVEVCIESRKAYPPLPITQVSIYRNSVLIETTNIGTWCPVSGENPEIKYTIPISGGRSCGNAK